MNATILVSNDDGINSEGIEALGDALSHLGEVYTVAPDRDQSASSHSLNLTRPLRIEEISERKFSVDGTPTDCVNLAVNGILANANRKPDIVVSGINMAANMGDDITYSGTVSAAMEATLMKIPAIAVSLAAKRNFMFETAAYYARLTAEFVLKSGLPENTLLNVNVPNLPLEKIKGIQVTRQGKRVYEAPIVENTDPRGKKYYWIGGNELDSLRIKNSDIVSVLDGYVSVTPIKLDMTNYEYLEELQKKLRNHG